MAIGRAFTFYVKTRSEIYGSVVYLRRFHCLKLTKDDVVNRGHGSGSRGCWDSEMRGVAKGVPKNSSYTLILLIISHLMPTLTASQNFRAFTTAVGQLTDHGVYSHIYRALSNRLFDQALTSGILAIHKYKSSPSRNSGFLTTLKLT